MRHYGKGGGLWNAMAFYTKAAVVADNAAEKAAADAELAALTAEEARLLGESDKILGEDKEVVKIEIPEEDMKVVVEEDGTIIVPAVAIAKPDNNTDKLLFLKSIGDGMQLHYLRMGSRPEILRYYVDAPAAGKYEMSMLVSTVSHEGSETTYRINRRAMFNTTLPYTKGMWELSKPQVIELKEGRNSVQITLRSPNRGISIKALQFKPAD